MPGEYVVPKAYNRHFAINLAAASGPAQWAEIAEGITSRGNSISEKTTEYTDMAGRGVAEKDTESITITRNFSGFRKLGDKAQDAVIDRLRDLNNRTVEYVEWYDNALDAEKNAWKGQASLSISDDGSGNAGSRESIAFSLTEMGQPVRGKVVASDGTITFTEVET